MTQARPKKLAAWRAFIGKHPGVVLIGALLMIGLAGALLALQTRRPPPPIGKSYFYDLSTGALFVADDTRVPPIMAPSGKRSADGKPTGVRAYVFSTGDCAEVSKRFIGYLEMYTPRAQATLLSRMAEVTGQRTLPATTPSDPQHDPEQDPVVSGRLLSVPGSKQWFSVTSDEGMAIVSDAKGKTPNPLFAQPCVP